MATIVTRAGKGSPLTNTEVDANFTNLNTDKAELSGAAFTGAITTNSTFDGRDVATDGTKLDTVETNADITDATNVTAAGALMDSELTSIASVKALNQGVATGDSPTFAALTSTGEITANGGIALGDGDKATFGAGDDLQIYHDGSNSYVTDVGTGNLWLGGANIGIGSPNASEYFINCTNNGAVTLYHNGSAKLDTTSTGINVTGKATMDGLVVSGGSLGAGGNDEFSFVGKLAAGRLVSDAGTTNIASINSTYNNDVLELTAAASDNFVSGIVIAGKYTTADSGEGVKLFRRSVPALGIDGNGDISFYEDTGTTPKLFWDASAESLGIGTSSPASKLHLADTSTVVTFEDTNSTNNSINTITNYEGTMILSVDPNNNSTVTESMRFSMLGAEAMRISSAGSVGIGTSTPLVKTHIAADVSAGSLVDSLLVSQNTSSSISGQGARILLSSLNASNRAAGIAAIAGSSSDHALAFYTNGNFANPTEKMRISSAGNVGIGTGSPSAPLSVVATSNQIPALGAASSHAAIGSGGFGTMIGTKSTGVGYIQQQRFDGTATSYSLLLQPNGGSLLVGGTTINAQGSFTVRPNQNNGSCIIQMNRSNTTATSTVLAFYNNNSTVGTITHNNTSTAYNTSSDQRLKDNIADADDAGSKIDSIQVRKYDWKADGSHQDYGMVAQELLEVAPEAVSVPEDSEEMMGVDYSKLVPMLIKEIQSLRNRVAQLETGE